MRLVAALVWLPLLMATAPSPQAAQCKFARDSRDAIHVRVELVGSAEIDELRIEMSREGDDVKTYQAVAQDEVWTAKPAGSPFRICEVNLLPVVAGYEVKGPTDCDYQEHSPEGAARHWDARYTFEVSPVFLMDLEVEPHDAAFRLRGQPFGPNGNDSECLPDRPEWRRLSGGGGDRELAARTRDALRAHPELASFAIEVRADQGTVRLQGRVANLAQIEAAEDSARKMGATGVDSKLVLTSELAGLARVPADEVKLEVALRGYPYLLHFDPEVIKKNEEWTPSIDDLLKQLSVPYDTRMNHRGQDALKTLLAGVETVRFRKR